MDFKIYKCPICEKQFEDNDDIVVCPKCGAPYHRDCYQLKNKCIFPELHKEHKSWTELNKPEDPKEVPPVEVEDDVIICKHCGHRNPLSANICERCGDLLDKPKTKVPPFFGENFYDEIENDEEGKSPFIRISTFDSDPFSDISFGLDNDEDYDGVSGKELINFVGSRRYYYGPVFKSIKKRNMNRFNFATFFFFELWYFYRKQYLKGFLCLSMILIPLIARIISSFFISPELKEKLIELSASNNYSNINALLDWLNNNASPLELTLYILPELMIILVFILKIFLAINANKQYYRFSVKKIKKIKAEPLQEGDDLLEKIRFAGGVNFSAAFCVFICEVILYFFITLL